MTPRPGCGEGNDGIGCVLLGAAPTADLDMDSGPRLVSAVRSRLAATPHARCLTIDLGSVEFIDGSGLGALAQIRHAAGSHGAHLTLRRVGRQVVDLLTLTGMDAVFDIESLLA